ncbi:class I SAM-dependent methyltransferase [Spirochaeta lutea]|uniref:Methyltransferase domain-containing protein n=1 Tax=Spirochaeta lutea TaxID=1480694 RepID=A0A098QXQ6_9SPIO|nr:class I SAM-dependent methyltransferase [Spirochaeta lutea]KGE72675.1 hypothetical protein DC28_06390 [Spirochaeta lutea]
MSPDRDGWLEALNRRPLGRTLDAACGDGEFGEELLVDGTGMSFLAGFDPESDSVDQARRHFRAYAPPGLTFEFVHSGIENLADRAPHFAQPDSWDTVCLGIALHHLPDPHASLNLLWSWVRPGGRLIISEMVRDGLDPAQEVLRDLHHLKARVDSLLGISHRETYSRDELADLVQAATPGAVPWGANPTTPNHGDGGNSWTEACPSSCRDGFLIQTEDQVIWDPRDHARRIDFIGDYILHVKHHREYAALRRQVSRLEQEIARVGARRPPRLNMILEKEPS